MPDSTVSMPGAPWSHDIDAVLAELQVDRNGLTAEEAIRRLAIVGPNRLPEAKPPGLLRLFLRQFRDPFIYVLLAAVGVSLYLRDFTDAGFIAVVLLINATIGTFQEWHAQRSADALRKLVPQRTTVRRPVTGSSRMGDRQSAVEIDAELLVPGDMVQLVSGSRVPADMRLVEARGLRVDESLLTGESTAVEKTAAAVLASATVLADRCNMLHAGSIVTQGRALGVVTATGIHSEVGRLAGSLAGQDVAAPPLLVRMKSFTASVVAVLAIVLVMLSAIELLRGAEWTDIFLLSVALAVAAIPEGLPVAVTVALAVSTRRMAARNVIVRKLVAVEALGSCTVIASDKTGTLTVNELKAVRAWLPGKHEVVIHPGSEPGRAEIIGGGDGGFARLVETAVLCSEASLRKEGNNWLREGDTVDLAFLGLALDAGFPPGKIRSDWQWQAGLPYEPEQGYAAAIHRNIHGEQRISVKGAAERVLPMSAHAQPATGDVMRVVESYGRKGFRVLAVAGKSLRAGDEVVSCEAQLHDLDFLGLVCMIDPLRPEARDAVASCRSAGIRVCMITGDHPATALAIARELGMADSAEEVVTGRELYELRHDDAALTLRVNNASVFARVEPEQKLDIVERLERAGEFVAVTGDGVNDAPALRNAHVGVAMGRRGTDVARDASDLLLADDNFASIAAGVTEGRIAYRNIRKVIFLLVSTGAAEIAIFLLSQLAGLPLPLTAVQLLWLNLVTNGIQHLTLAFEPGEGDEMQRAPRRPDEPIFNRSMVERIVLSAATMGIVATGLFGFLLHAGFDVDSARNTTLLLMVLFENVQVFNSRSETTSVFRQSLLGNPLLLAGTVTAQLLHVLSMHLSLMQDVLGIAPVSLETWVACLLLAAVLLLAIELWKRIRASQLDAGYVNSSGALP